MHDNTVKPPHRKLPGTREDCGDATPSRKRFLLGELIGERVQLAWSGRGPQALDGTVVDETQNAFVVLTRTGEKRIPKAGNVFYFPSAHCRVDGSTLACKPEERTKKLAKKI
ncbi:MAG: ribonuclease P protein subunit [Candidatus Micrarchaeota archaeon]